MNENIWKDMHNNVISTFTKTSKNTVSARTPQDNMTFLEITSQSKVIYVFYVLHSIGT